jgi:transcriptional regulator with GAF, ATPase, and Fis domain
VAESAALRAVLARVDLVAPTDTSVLVLGESGTGKELVAQEIHRRSRRADGPLVAVNCASVPRELFESEFFGHVKGAFTGALRGRSGRFQDADGGTLFLDEVAEIPLDMQAKLLRVLQEGRFERIGEGTSRRADVRVVAATNRNLLLEVEAGRFRSDLYYRLDVFPIELPPLRNRPEAIEPLVRHFLERFAVELALPRPGLDEATLRRLQAYHWPGNVRELQNVVERGVILSRGGRLRVDLCDEPWSRPERTPEAPAERSRVLTAEEVRRFERNNLEAALTACRGKVYGRGGAAELLGMAPSTLIDRLRRLGVTAGRRGTVADDRHGSP